MGFFLTADEKARLGRMVSRPRTRRQRFIAQAVLDLSLGVPTETVARNCRVGVDRVEYWLKQFMERRTAFLEEKNTLRVLRRRREKERRRDRDNEMRNAS